MDTRSLFHESHDMRNDVVLGAGSAHVTARIDAAGTAPMHCCTSPGTS
jgi:hypothetical protein